MTLDGFTIFKGEITRACGDIVGGSEDFGEVCDFVVLEKISALILEKISAQILEKISALILEKISALIDDFRGACAVKGNVQVAGRTSSASTTEMLSTHDVTLRNVDGSLFHVQI